MGTNNQGPFNMHVRNTQSSYKIYEQLDMRTLHVV